MFLFSSPSLFFEAVKLLVMLIALNFAFWLIYFVGSVSSPGWKVLCIVPPVLSFLVYVYVVKTAALLKAIVRLNQDSLVEVLEQTEGAHEIATSIRQQLLDVLEGLGGSPKEQLQALFGKMDSDNSGSLTRKEFASFLHSLGIYPTRKKWIQIFRLMDRNADNDISFVEFQLFVFPDSTTALASEELRLSQIRSRVVEKTVQLTQQIQAREQRKKKGGVAL